MNFVAPKFGVSAFNCPHCQAYAHQSWFNHVWAQREGLGIPGGLLDLEGQFAFSICAHCNVVALWRHEELIYPVDTVAPPPHEDMPPDLVADFEEARGVFPRSARSSAALLRLIIQKLCKHLGYPGKDINDDIAAMVKDGLDPLVEQSLDVVRVIGNESVHPGTIDLRDEPETALELFHLVNFIVEDRITRPAKIRAIHGRLPASKLEGIEARDKKAKAAP